MSIRKRIGWIAVLLGVLLLAMTALPALADGLAGVWAGRRTLQDQPETELTLPAVFCSESAEKIYIECFIFS